MNDDIDPNPIKQYFRDILGNLANFFVRYSTDYKDLNWEKDQLKKTRRQLLLNLQSQKERHQARSTDYETQIKGLEREVREARLQGIKEGKPLGIAEGKRIANQATRGLVEATEQTLRRAAMRRAIPEDLNVDEALKGAYAESERENLGFQEDNERLRVAVIPHAVEIALQATPKYNKIPFGILVREGNEYALRFASKRFQRKYDGLEIDINEGLNSDERIIKQLNAGKKSSITIGKNQIGLEPYVIQGKLGAIGIYVAPIVTDRKKSGVVSRTVKQANNLMSGIKKGLESLGEDYSPKPA